MDLNILEKSELVELCRFQQKQINDMESFIGIILKKEDQLTELCTNLLEVLEDYE